MENKMACFDRPINAVPGRSADRFECVSPKLGRRVVLFDRWSLDQWVLLEADPTVTRFCEQPIWLRLKPHRRWVDFWVEENGQDYWLMVRIPPDKKVNDVTDPEPVADLGAGVNDKPVRSVTPIDLIARKQLIDNWRRIVPYLVANQRWLPESTVAEVARTLKRPTMLGTLEQRFKALDIVLLRTAVFVLLQRGQIVAPSLADKPLGPRTVFARP